MFGWLVLLSVFLEVGQAILFDAGCSMREVVVEKRNGKGRREVLSPCLLFVVAVRCGLVKGGEEVLGCINRYVRFFSSCYLDWVLL